MINEIPSRKHLYCYIGLLLLVSWIIQITAIAITGDVNSEAAGIWLAATMISPLIVTVIFLGKNKSLRQRLLRRPNRINFKLSNDFSTAL
jgi:uncharacterized protein